MQREQFENWIKRFLPEATDEAMAVWTAYADELEQDNVELKADFYGKNYVELFLTKQHYGEEIATQIFNYGTQFPFNYFELRGAAAKLANGWTLENVARYTLENGCDATPEERKEFLEVLQAFQASTSLCAEKGREMDNKRTCQEQESVETMLKGTPPSNILVSFDGKPACSLEALQKERKPKKKERGEAR